MGQLEGKIAIVTAATSGIGERTAELFVAEGAKIAIAGRRKAVAYEEGTANSSRDTHGVLQAYNGEIPKC